MILCLIQCDDISFSSRIVQADAMCPVWTDELAGGPISYYFKIFHH